MDLAELRKKANANPASSQGQNPNQQGIPQGASGTSLPDALTDLEPGIDERMSPAGSEPTPLEPDPIDALFAYPGDLAVASEGVYLQGLEEKQRHTQRDSIQWLTFSLGNEEYALDIEKISEIIKPREITELPRVPGFILGIISLRGVVVPIFDLKQRLHLGAAIIGASSRIVVCQHEDRYVGLLVDRISQVVRMAKETLEPPPASLSGVERDLVEGVGRHQQKMMILLNLVNVMNAELS